MPQAEDLEKLHQRYGGLAEAALKSARDGGVRKWYKERICRPEEDNEDDIRQWHETFKIMSSFGIKDETSMITLSDPGTLPPRTPLTQTQTNYDLKTFMAR